MRRKLIGFSNAILDTCCRRCFLAQSRYHKYGYHRSCDRKRKARRLASSIEMFQVVSKSEKGLV